MWNIYILRHKTDHDVYASERGPKFNKTHKPKFWLSRREAENVIKHWQDYLQSRECELFCNPCSKKDIQHFVSNVEVVKYELVEKK